MSTRIVADEVFNRSDTRNKDGMDLILWLIAVILVVGGIVSLLRGQLLYGALLIIVGLLIGPGGVSVFT
jgi:hypothetical protein